MAAAAVTGDIGAGKSTVSKLLAHNLSCECLSADVIAKSMWLREDVKAQAVNHFGSEILDSSGEIILPELASLVFSDESNHAFVNSLIHPLDYRASMVMQSLKYRYCSRQDIMNGLML